MLHPRRLAAVILLFGVIALSGRRPPRRARSCPTPPIRASPPKSPSAWTRGLAEADRLRAAWQLDAARQRYEAIVIDATQANARRHLAAALWGRGRVQGFQSDRAGAKASHQQALAIYRELNDLPGEAMASRYLGMNLFHLAELEASRQTLDRAIELYRELNDVAGLATAYNNLVYLVPDRSPEKEVYPRTCASLRARSQRQARRVQRDACMGRRAVPASATSSSRKRS